MPVAEDSALRLLYVVRRYPVTSQTFVSNEVKELRRQGADVKVLSLWQPDDPTSEALVLGALRMGRATQVRALAVLALRHPRRVAKFLRLRTALRDEPIPWGRVLAVAVALRDFRASVIHAHFAWEGASVAWALGLLLDRPWSMTVHANDLFSEPSHLSEKLAAADAVVTVCDYNEQWLREEAGYEKSVHKVVCGVEVPTRPDSIDPASTDVLAIGRLVEKKGFDVLIGAVAELRRRGQHLRCEIVGDGPERERLQGLADPLGGAVRLLGELPHDVVLDRMWRARVVCVPSRIAADGDRDSMPLVAKEAMARCVPVVGTKVGGIPEMVDANCGAVVPPDDAQRLAEALATTLADEVRREQLGRNGRRRVEERFTLAGEVRKLRTVFEELNRDE